MKYEVTKVVHETHDVVSIHFSGPKMDYKPGQFVMLDFPMNGTLVKRAYSIASSPTEKDLILCVKEMPGGLISPKLKRVKEGDTFELKGPFGHFVFDSKTHQTAVFLGAGSGIAPFRSALKFANDKKILNSITLFTSQKTLKDDVYHNYFDLISQENDPINVHHVLTREEKDTKFKGRLGRIDLNYLKDTLGTFDDTYFFLCGPASFVTNLKQILLDNGVPKDMIKFEVYG